MKAMIWKELRENAKWGVLGSAVLALGTLYLVSQANGRYRNPYDDVWSACTTMTSIGAPILAALLGLLQILPEQRRDQWAFLMHRPVSRSTIFGGKVSAGLIIYLLATGIPYGCAMLWALTPGHIAMPADPRLVWPGVVDILMGLTCYFAGILTALRPARWYGSRALGFGAAVWGILLTISAVEVWQALLWCLIFVAVVGVAAWSSFTTDGEYQPQPKLARFGLGTVLYCGTVTAVAGTIALVASIVSGFLPENITPPFDQYVIDTLGRVLRVHYENEPSQGSVPVSATDLDGKPVPLAKARDRYAGAQFLDGQDLVWNKRYNRDTGYRRWEHYFLQQSTHSDAAWFYLRDERRFVGFSSVTKKLIGYLGPAGFTPPREAHGSRFDGDLREYSDHYDSTLFHFPTKAYAINFMVPSITLLARVDPPSEIRGVCSIVSRSRYDNSSSGNTAPLPAAILVGNQIRVVGGHGQLMFTTPLRYNEPPYFVRVYGTANGQKYFFWYSPFDSYTHPQWEKLPSHIIELNAHGVVLREYTLPLLPTSQPEAAPMSAGLTGLAAPPGLLLGYLAQNTIQGWRGLPTFESDWRNMEPTVKTMWVLLVMFSLVAAVCSAAAAWQIGRRCAFSRREQWAWTIGVFWLGLFGLLTLLALRGWPAREVCPTCGQRRVVTREHCEHCGADFPPPRPDGTEIFDLGSLAAVAVE